MSALRTRMIDDMTLAGLATGTQQMYASAVRRLTAHYRRGPDQLTEEEVRSYLLQLRQRGVARGTFKVSQYGLRFFFLHTRGTGEQAVHTYLARYVFRVALTNARIVGLDDHTVSFRYKHRKSDRWRICQLNGQEFMRRFLQHVLPRGFHKVRYFGLWHPAQRDNATRVRHMLQLDASLTPAPPQHLPDPPPKLSSVDASSCPEPLICPHCHHGKLIFIRRLTPQQAMGP